MRIINKIIIHHTGTKDGNHNDWENIRRYHTSYVWNDREVTEDVYKDNRKNKVKQKGYCREPWSDIGYHFGTEVIDGQIVLQNGRNIEIQGAHCRGKNRNSIGFVIVGNFDISYPSSKMISWSARYLSDIICTHDWWDVEILPHRDFCKNSKGEYWKHCPGKKFNMKYFIKEVNRFSAFNYYGKMNESSL